MRNDFQFPTGVGREWPPARRFGCAPIVTHSECRRICGGPIAAIDNRPVGTPIAYGRADLAGKSGSGLLDQASAVVSESETPLAVERSA